jgi:hypothetical protein
VCHAHYPHRHHESFLAEVAVLVLNSLQLLLHLGKHLLSASQVLHSGLVVVIQGGKLLLIFTLHLLVTLRDILELCLHLIVALQTGFELLLKLPHTMKVGRTKARQTARRVESS